MAAKRTNVAALLQKVDSQLRGERVPLKSKEEDELSTYLNILTSKTLESRSVNLEEDDDVPLSIGADGGMSSRLTVVPGSPSPAASRFLKKKPAPDARSSQDVVARTTDISTRKQHKGSNNEQRQGEGHISLKKEEGSGGDKGVQGLPGAAGLNYLKSQKSSGKEDRFGAHTPESMSAKRNFLKEHKLLQKSIQGHDEDVAGRVVSGQQDMVRGVGSGQQDMVRGVGSGQQDMVRGVGSGQQDMVRGVGSGQQDMVRGVGSGQQDMVRGVGSGQQDVSEQDSLAEFIKGLSRSKSPVKQPANLVAQKHHKWKKRAPSSASPSPVPTSRTPSPSKSPFEQLSRSGSQDFDRLSRSGSLDFERLSRSASLNSEAFHKGKHQKTMRDKHKLTHSDYSFHINLQDVASLLPSSPSPPPPVGKATKIQDYSKHPTASPPKTPSPAFKSSSLFSANEKQKQMKKPLRKSSVKKLGSGTSLFSLSSLHMADELPGFQSGDGRSDQSELSKSSEIKTESLGKLGRIKQMSSDESDVVTHLENVGKSKSSKMGKVVKVSSKSELSDDEYSNSPKDKHSEQFTDAEDYSSSFESTNDGNVSARSQQKSRLNTQTSKRQSNRGRGHRVVMEEVQMEVSAADKEGGSHHWNTTHTGLHVQPPLWYSGQSFDPAPVSTHVVSAETLQALTAYSPNMLALHEMMKAQVQLVQNFVDIQRRIYQSCMDGLHHDHKYTTLEDTKEFLRKNQKPRLTLKEVLELVEKEEATLVA